MNRMVPLGQYGSNIQIGPGGTTSGKWVAIGVLSATVLVSLTDATTSVAGAWSSVSLAAGIYLFGAFTSFEVATGAVIAYKNQAD